MGFFFFIFEFQLQKKNKFAKSNITYYRILLIEYTLNSENARKLSLFSFEQRH